MGVLFKGEREGRQAAQLGRREERGAQNRSRLLCCCLQGVYTVSVDGKAWFESPAGGFSVCINGADSKLAPSGTKVSLVVCTASVAIPIARC